MFDDFMKRMSFAYDKKPEQIHTAPSLDAEIPEELKAPTLYKGNAEDAKLSSLHETLSDPEFLKTFGFPSDWQYEILRQELFHTPQQTADEVSALQDFYTTSEQPLFGLLRHASFLKTVAGQRVSAYGELADDSLLKKEEKEKLQILYQGLSEVEQNEEMPYLLSQAIHPDYSMKPYGPLQKWQEAITPVFIDQNYAVVDTGTENSFHILKIPSEKRDEVHQLIGRYKETMMQGQPHNRPEPPKNASLAELREYHKKYSQPTLRQEIRVGLPRELEQFIIPFQEQYKLFPHVDSFQEAIDDPVMFEVRSFFKQPIRDAINKDLQIDLEKLSFQEQIYFLTYIAKTKNKDFEKLRSFAHAYHEEGLRTFLSLAHGGEEMGEKILELGEKLDHEMAQHVFEKYRSIIDRVNTITDRARERYGEQLQSKDLEVMQEKLYFFAKDILRNAFDALQRGEDMNKSIQALDTVDVGLYEFTQLYSRYRGDLESLGLTIEIELGAEINQKDQETMRRMFIAGRKKFSSPEGLQALERDFSQLFNVEKNEQFLVLRNNEQTVIGFLSFQDRENDERYVRSLSFHEQASHPVVAHEFIEKAWQKIGNKTITLLVQKDNIMSRMYTKRFDFEIIEVLENFDNTGETYYRMRREPKQ